MPTYDLTYNGYRYVENMNKNSTHPNPWRPPNMIDCTTGYYSNSYKIYKPKNEEKMFVPDTKHNMLVHGPFSERFRTALKYGICGGKYY